MIYLSTNLINYSRNLSINLMNESGITHLLLNEVIIERPSLKNFDKFKIQPARLIIIKNTNKS